jgi:hypothetical protein
MIEMINIMISPHDAAFTIVELVNSRNPVVSKLALNVSNYLIIIIIIKVNK